MQTPYSFVFKILVVTVHCFVLPVFIYYMEMDGGRGTETGNNVVENSSSL